MPTSISNPATFSSVRTAFNTEGYGISTSLFAYRQGGGIVPATSGFNAIGAGTGGDPLQLSQFSGFSVPSRVTLDNATVTNEPERGVDYTGRYQLNSDGNIYLTDSFGTLYNYIPWLISGSASDFEARVGTLDSSGGTPGGSAFNTWLNLGTTREWTLAVTVPNAAFRTGVVEIRLASSSTVIATGSVFFSIDTA